MKSIRYKLFIAFSSIALFFLSACDEEEIQLFDGDSYVAFKTGATTLNESASATTADGQVSTAPLSAEIEVFRSSTNLDDAITVSVSVSSQFLSESTFAQPGDDATGTFTISEDIGNITFEPGEASKKFTLVTINDLQSSGDKEVTFTINSVSGGDYKVGLAGTNFNTTSHRVVIVDDDCPIDLPTDWAGDYELTTLCAAPGSFNEGFCVGAAEGSTITLTPDANDPLGITAILSGGVLADNMVLQFNTCPQTVEFEGTIGLTFNQNSAQATIFPPDEPDVFGTGSFNPDARRISVIVSYGNVSGSNFDEFIMELSKL